MPTVRILFTVLLLGSAAASAAAARPNVLVMLADDQGIGDLSLHGNRNLSTPNLDRLAGEGARFSRFYVQPLCAPTRAEFLTGRWAGRGGVTGVTKGTERLDPEVPTIADAFREAGYATAMFGKWHNGTQAPYHPLCRGFEEFYGYTSGHWADYYSPMLDHNGELTKGEGFLCDDLTDHAIDFIEQNDGTPFFAYVAFNTPHSPMQVPDRWWDRHADQELLDRGTEAKREDVPHTRAALAMVENIDWNVGRLLEALERRGVADDTIVVYFSDNGPNGHRFTGGLRGKKGSVDEGGTRSPLFVRFPGQIDAGVEVAAPAAAIDLAPTLTSLAGVTLPTTPARDGVSLAEPLTGETDAWPERTLVTYHRRKAATREGDFVLDEKGRLYDLAADPGQTRDIASARPEVVSRLTAARDRWAADVGVPVGKGKQADDDRPFTVGHRGLTTTQLPPRDALFSGTVSRNSKSANSTFVVDWDDTEDEISWKVDVVEAGTFEATLLVTCPADAVGSTVELRLGEASVAGVVDVAFDPPLTARARDRAVATEGDMKEFTPLTLGTVDLPAGRGRLTLRATDVPGDAVADLRLLLLRRVEAGG
ncbi:MAG: arylsulfatase [Planctomycetota bacterium]